MSQKYTDARYPEKINDLIDNEGNVNPEIIPPAPSGGTKLYKHSITYFTSSSPAPKIIECITNSSESFTIIEQHSVAGLIKPSGDFFFANPQYTYYGSLSVEYILVANSMPYTGTLISINIISQTQSPISNVASLTDTVTEL